MDDIPCPMVDEEEDCAVEPYIERGAIMSLDTLQSTLMAKVAESSLEEGALAQCHWRLGFPCSAPSVAGRLVTGEATTAG